MTAVGLLVFGALVTFAVGEPRRLPRPLPRLPGNVDAMLPTPVDNPLLPARVGLGRRLFFDPGLSADGSTSCATCHRPELGFSDGRARSVGVGGRIGRRNALSLVDCAYRRTLFWDGRASSLEGQALLPIENRDEMGHSVEGVLVILQDDESYRDGFEAAFGTPGVSRDRLAEALASFQRTLVSPPTPFDRGELGPAASRGHALFEGRARCNFCHRGRSFTDGRFHNTGVGWSDQAPDRGRFEVTKRTRDLGLFRTPSLRGLLHTAPYMHDGSMATLEDVVDFYDRGAGPNPYLDPILRPLGLTAAEKRDLLAFLESLSADVPVWSGSDQ